MKKIVPIIILVTLTTYLIPNVTYGQKDKYYLTQYNLPLLKSIQDSLNTQWASSRNYYLILAKELSIPITIQDKEGNVSELQWIDTPSNTPIYYTTFNVNAAKSTRTNRLHTGGALGLSLDGAGMNAAVWDAGLARATHQEYQTLGTSRYTVGDSSTTLHAHAAHVTGTIMATGVDTLAKGMAPLATVTGYKWDNDISEAYGEAAAGLLISNHSYGYTPSALPPNYFGAYDGRAMTWDRLHYYAPYYLQVVAAGNSGSTSPNTSPMDPALPQYDKLSGFNCTKNNLVVANAQDAVIDSATGNLVSVTINSTSSQGPTDDYRIKPDITGNGTTLYSTLSATNTAYGSNTGTSMASPNVAGSLLLLQEHYYNLTSNYLRAASLKGLALHTADDAGIPGPDANYGWGLLDTREAATLITNDKTSALIQELSLIEGQTYSRTLTSDGVNPLKVSISWTDPHSLVNTTLNDTTAVLVNDLDIRITRNDTTFYPWRLTGVVSNAKGDNYKDPYEQIEIIGAAGDYTITISHKDSLKHGLQSFTLIASGINYIVSCNPTTPTGVVLSDTTDHSLTVGWNAIIDASYQVIYRAASASVWDTINTASNSVVLSGLAASTTYEVMVRAVCGTVFSPWTAPYSYTTWEQQYCISEGTNTSDEYLSRVVLHTLDNASLGSPAGYQDFTNIYTNLVKGSSYEIKLYPVWPGTPYPDGFAVYIDYDNNRIFDPVSELVFSKAPSVDTLAQGSFTVPMSATEDTVRMRVSLKYSGVPSPCELFDYGEVEDYSLILSSVPLHISQVVLSGSRVHQDNKIQWTTATPELDKEYSLEYSSEGIHFHKLITYTAQAQMDAYEYSHRISGSPNHYYRVKTTSPDLQEKYSNVIMLHEANIATMQLASIQPIPAKDIITLTVADLAHYDDLQYTIIDMKGIAIMTGKVMGSKQSIDISSCSTGSYYMILSDSRIKPIFFIKNE